MSVRKFYHLVDIPDFRFEKNCDSMCYGDIATDCDTKTISLLEAIGEISFNIFTLSDKPELDKDKINMLSGIISDLAELAIATNKISQSASYLSGIKEGNKNVS